MGKLLTVAQMRQAKKEIRVYVFEAGNNLHPNDNTDEEIMDYCERTGGVYTLEYFEEQCNNEELNLSNSFIRII
jgi:hypothetical protein